VLEGWSDRQRPRFNNTVDPRSLSGSQCGEQFGYHRVDRLHRLDLPPRQTHVKRKACANDLFLALRRPGKGTPRLPPNGLVHARLKLQRRK